MAHGALSLFVSQGGPVIALPDQWRYQYAATGAGEIFASPDFNDTTWPETPVPAQHEATKERGAIWYRVRFKSPTGGLGRWLLQFKGAFQSTTVWLNGKHLGQHYGYFAPFAFDITDDLEPENLLTVCCESRIEWDLPAKKTPMGVLNDWDCKPYPNGARGALPDTYAWTQPLGLWAPVTLISTGNAVMEHVHYTPDLRSDGSAVVQVTARVTSLVEHAISGKLSVFLAPANSTGSETPTVSAPIRLRPHRSQVIELAIPVADPQLWWPWTHGEQHLYTGTATLTLGDQTRAVTESRFGIRSVEYRGESEPEGPGWLINGRPIFPMGSNYLCDFRLDTATYERHRADLQLMKDANMNLVRVHAHVEPDSFYEAADELGLLVMADGVLNGSYVFGAPPEDRVFFAWAARDQVEKLIRYLLNHPSIVVWVMHNEPPWPAHCWWFGDPHRFRANREVDLNVTLLAQDLDPSRPVITASGEKDIHTYGGWYHDTWLVYRKASPRFCTEYGAQALPSLDSPFWQEVSTVWPVEPTDPTWVYRDYQAYQWSSFGIGAPSQFPTLAEYVDASQKYQAWISRYGAEQFRKHKWKPSAGIAHFMFVDGHPAITWSVVDYHRLPKQAYYALRDAFRPTHVIIDPAGEFTGDRMGNVIYRPGQEVSIDLWLVNDNPTVKGDAVIEWMVDGQHGAIPVVIPTDTEPVRFVQTVRWMPPAGLVGAVTLRTVLRQGERLLEEHALDLLIQPETEGAGRPDATGPLIEVVGIQPGEVGFRFALQNPHHPVAWKEILSLATDGVEAPLSDLLIERDGTLHSVDILPATPLHFMTATPVWFVCRALAPGDHTLTLRARVAGYGPVTFTFSLPA